MIKPRFTNADLTRLFKQKSERMEQVIIQKLLMIGEQFINNARNNHTYLDQTGNLTASIGYAIGKNGKTIKESSFDKVKNSDKGQKDGAKLVRKLLKQYNKGYVLIGVAGMDYAAGVESKGKDVISGSYLQVKKDMQKAFKSFRG